MITKAIVEEVIDAYSARIRIPIFHKTSSSSFSIPRDELPIASICTMPGCKMSLRPGSVVWVAFELGKLELPVIIGVLSTPDENASSDMRIGSLNVEVSCKLPKQIELAEEDEIAMNNFEDMILNNE